MRELCVTDGTARIRNIFFFAFTDLECNAGVCSDER